MRNSAATALQQGFVTIINTHIYTGDIHSDIHTRIKYICKCRHTRRHTHTQHEYFLEGGGFCSRLVVYYVCMRQRDYDTSGCHIFKGENKVDIGKVETIRVFATLKSSMYASHFLSLLLSLIVPDSPLTLPTTFLVFTVSRDRFCFHDRCLCPLAPTLVWWRSHRYVVFGCDKLGSPAPLG